MLFLFQATAGIKGKAESMNEFVRAIRENIPSELPLLAGPVSIKLQELEEGHVLHIKVPKPDETSEGSGLGATQNIVEALKAHDLSETIFSDYELDGGRMVTSNIDENSLSMIIPIKKRGAPETVRKKTSLTLDELFAADVELVALGTPTYTGENANKLKDKMRERVANSVYKDQVLEFLGSRSQRELSSLMGDQTLTLGAMAYDIVLHLETRGAPPGAKKGILKKDFGKILSNEDITSCAEGMDVLMGNPLALDFTSAITSSQRPKQMKNAMILSMLEKKSVEQQYMNTIISMVLWWHALSFFSNMADSSIKLAEDAAKDDQYMEKARQEEIQKAQKKIGEASTNEDPSMRSAVELYRDLHRVATDSDLREVTTLSDADKNFYKKNAAALMGYMNYVGHVVDHADDFGGPEKVKLALTMGELIGRSEGDVDSGRLEKLKTDIRSLYGQGEKAQKVLALFDNPAEFNKLVKQVVSEDPSAYMVVGNKGEVLLDEQGQPIPNNMKISLSVSKKLGGATP